VPDKHFDWNVLIANKNKEIARLSDLYRANVVKAGVEIIDERAEMEDAHTIRLKKSGRTVTAERILIATGGRPSAPPGGLPGAEHCIDSNGAFYLEKLPRRIVVVGGGYIALEFAHIFHGLGVHTTLVYRGDKVLRGFDMDMRDALCDSMHKSGLRIVTNRNFKRIDKRGDELFAVTDHDEILEADAIMMAVGRVPNTDGMGLENAGVKLGAKGEVKVDDYSQTNVPHINAIGDVTDRLQLTPVAIHEAMCFWNTVYNGKPTKVNHSGVPTAVFTRPEIGTVGLSEEKALAAGHAIDVYKSSFRPLKHTMSGRDTRALFKLVVDAKTDKVLGCHIFGFDAGEIIQTVAVAMKMGATKADFDNTIALHPSAAEELVTVRTKSYSKEAEGAA